VNRPPKRFSCGYGTTTLSVGTRTWCIPAVVDLGARERQTISLFLFLYNFEGESKLGTRTDLGLAIGVDAGSSVCEFSDFSGGKFNKSRCPKRKKGP